MFTSRSSFVPAFQSTVRLLSPSSNILIVSPSLPAMSVKPDSLTDLRVVVGWGEVGCGGE